MSPLFMCIAWPFKAKSNLRILLRQPATFARAYRVPLLVLAIGAVLDAATTVVQAVRYGPRIESHPAQRFVIEIAGPITGPVLAKIIQLVFVLLVASLWCKWCGWILLICGLLYTAAAVSNHFFLL